MPKRNQKLTLIFAKTQSNKNEFVKVFQGKENL